MKNLFIFDPTQTDSLVKFRGGGRIIQILKENFQNSQFINKLPLFNGRLKVIKQSVFLNPIFNPFQPPLTLKRVAKKQIQLIFDVIPLKYPSYFPIGFRGKFNLWLNKYSLKNYDKIVTISNHSKKDIVKYLKIPQEKIEVIYPTLPKVFINQKQNPKNLKNEFLPSNYCLYVGDVNWNKNLVNLAKAIKIINVTCVFVGKVFENLTSLFNLSHPWLKEFHQFLKEVKNDKRFIFLGYVDDYRLIKLYQQARVNILISRDEGFGFSFLEAASCGCPSVLADIEIFQEIAGDCALFANPNNPYDIANKIGEIYFNKKLKDQLGFKAWQRAKFFSQERFIKNFKRVLEL